jgi:P27 family predicted phage terminase small subunit
MTIIEGGDGTPIPEEPKHWPATFRSREVWQRLWRVGRSWLSNEAHYDLIRLLVEAIDDRDRLRARMRKESMIVSGSAGQPQPHPGYRELDNMEGKIARLLDQAGFTPARQRMGVKAGAGGKSKLAELRAEGKVTEQSGAG